VNYESPFFQLPTILVQSIRSRCSNLLLSFVANSWKRITCNLSKTKYLLTTLKKQFKFNNKVTGTSSHVNNVYPHRTAWLMKKAERLCFFK